MREEALSTGGTDLLPPSLFGELSRLCLQEPTSLHLDDDSLNAETDWESLEDTCGVRVVVRGVGDASRLPRRFLRVLICWSNPSSGEYPPLQHLEAEVEAVANGLRAPECRHISIKELPHATALSIKSRIRTWKPHVVHFVGHCQKKHTASYLVVEDGKGGQDELYAADLARAIAEAKTQLLVLSGCHTSEIAVQISTQGGATAIGIRDRVGDQYAYAWSRALYAALGAGANLEEAVAQTRLAVKGYKAENRPILVLGNGGADQLERPQPPTNLPTFLRPFVGRHRQRSEIAEKLLTSKIRLLTLHAMGGMGKTRLACQVGWDVLSHYEDGVWFVDCDFLSTGDQLIAAICEVVGANPSAGIHGLQQFLAEARLLLVIDCFERFVDEYRTLTEILARCPGVQMLVTSRIVLDEGLTYPLLPMADGTETKGTEALELFESLAIERTGLDLTRTTRNLCKKIVRLLQGVPLAIVLCASQLQNLSLEELHERLSKSLLGQSRRHRSREDKHESLVRVVSDSFDLLPEEGRRLAVALSVFHGSFSMKDARAVLCDFKDVENGIYLLCDHAMLSPSGIGGSTRYRALDTVREYLAGLSHTVNWETLRERHFDHYRALAQDLRHSLSVSAWSVAAKGFVQDLGNFRAMWRFACEKGDPLSTLHVASLLSRPFYEIGLKSDFMEMARLGQVEARRLNDREALSEFIGLLGSQAGRDGDYAEAETLWREKIDICRELGDESAASEILLDLALLHSRSGNPSKALELLDEFQTMSSGVPDAMALRGQILADLGRIEDARTECAGAEALAQTGPPLSARFLAMTLSTAYLAIGDIERSRRHALEMLRISLELGFDQPAGRALILLARGFIAEGDLAMAQRCATAAACMPRGASESVWSEAKSVLVHFGWAEPTRAARNSWPEQAKTLERRLQAC